MNASEHGRLRPGVGAVARTPPARADLVVDGADAWNSRGRPHRLRALVRALGTPAQDDVTAVEAFDGDLVVVDARVRVERRDDAPLQSLIEHGRDRRLEL